MGPNITVRRRFLPSKEITGLRFVRPRCHAHRGGYWARYGYVEVVDLLTHEVARTYGLHMRRSRASTLRVFLRSPAMFVNFDSSEQAATNKVFGRIESHHSPSVKLGLRCFPSPAVVHLLRFTKEVCYLSQVGACIRCCGSQVAHLRGMNGRAWGSWAHSDPPPFPLHAGRGLQTPELGACMEAGDMSYSDSELLAEVASALSVLRTRLRPGK